MATILFSCGNSPNLCSQTFYGYWGETAWQFDFEHRDSFVFNYEGHYSTGTTRGSYQIKEDTLTITSVSSSTVITHGILNEKYIIDNENCCLIDTYNKYDYCERDVKGSKFRSIEFPQIKSNSLNDYRLIDSLFLNIVYDIIKGSDQSFSARDTIYVKPYFEVGKILQDTTFFAGANIDFTKTNSSYFTWDRLHIEIEKVNWNRGKQIFIQAKMYPHPWDDSIFAFYTYDNGKYIRERRYSIE